MSMDLASDRRRAHGLEDNTAWRVILSMGRCIKAGRGACIDDRAILKRNPREMPAVTKVGASHSCSTTLPVTRS
jgi:hypothetical protein